MLYIFPLKGYDIQQWLPVVHKGRWNDEIVEQKEVKCEEPGNKLQGVGWPSPTVSPRFDGVMFLLSDTGTPVRHDRG